MKKPKTVSFRSLADSRDDPGEFQMEDWSKWGRAKLLHHVFLALDNFADAHNGSMPLNKQDADSVVTQVQASWNGEQDGDLDEALVHQVALLAQGTCSPICSFMGGLIAAEALKVTGKFTPCMQYMYYDILECVPKKPLESSQRILNDRFDGQRWLFGAQLQNRLNALSVFVVGAGALGCELLKSLACMGVSCDNDNKGLLSVTDMDHIEKSNLNRQFLFRAHHLGHPKSATACQAVSKMNPQMHIKAHETPVGEDTESTFDGAFWKRQDVVINALDTWSARLYVDSKCVEYGKPLLESGTLGASGHTQIVVPGVTLNFGATRIQKETAVPQCTIHHFPHTIHHTLTWARQQFDQLFVQGPAELCKQYRDAQYLPGLLSRMPQSAQWETMSRLHRVHSFAQNVTPLKCVAEARRMFDAWFQWDIQELLATHPHDALDEDGGPFWAPPRRAPEPIEFDFANAAHLLFVQSAAALLAHRHNVATSGIEEEHELLQMVSRVTMGQEQRQQHTQNDYDESAFETMKRNVGAAAADPVRNDNNVDAFVALNSADFEKDDDSNHHIDFLHAAGMLRAINYGITPIDRLQSKKIAGNIVPAMVTTTAAVTGLVLTQLYHLATNNKDGPPDIETLREANLDLASNLLALGEPQACKVCKTTEHYRAVPEGWTLWDSLDIRLGGAITVLALGKWLGKTYGIKMRAVSSGGVSLFRASDVATREERARMKVLDIYRKLKGQDSIPAHVDKLVLSLLCVDKETGKDVEMPTVYFYFKDDSNADKRKNKKKKKKKKQRKLQ